MVGATLAVAIVTAAFLGVRSFLHIASLGAPTINWDAGGKPISTNHSVGSGGPDQTSTAIDSGDNTIMAWRDRAPQGIYAQKVDHDGNAQWTPTDPSSHGLEVTATNSFNPQVITDGTDTFIAYLTLEFPSFLVFPVVQKLDANGVKQWGPEGIQLSTDGTGCCSVHKIITDGSGGIISVWSDARSGNYALYGQRVDSAGAIQWTANGVTVLAEPGQDLHWMDIDADGTGGAFVASVRIPFSPPPIAVEYYVQHLNGAGSAQYGTAGVLAQNALSDPGALPYIIADDTGGFLLAFDNAAVGPAGCNGAGGTPAQGFDLYAQRYDSTGAPQWPNPGAPSPVAISTALGDQRFSQDEINAHSIVPDGSGGLIAVFTDCRANTGFSIYAQRINGSGNTLWTADGVHIADIPPFTIGFPTQTSYDAIEDGEGGAVVAYATDTNQNGSLNADMMVDHLDSVTGAPDWGPIVLANAARSQFRGHIARSGSEYSVSWIDDRNDPGPFTDYTDIYAQHLSVPAPPPPPPDIPDPVWTAAGELLASGDTTTPHEEATGLNGRSQIVQDQDGNFVVFYVDVTTHKIRGQKFMPDGTILWPTGSPVPEGKIVREIGSQSVTHVAAATDGSNGFHLVMDINQDGGPTGATTPFWIEVNSDGVVVNENYLAFGNPCAVGNAAVYFSDGFTNVIVPDGTGGVFIAWIAENSGATNICAQHVDIFGNFLFDTFHGTFISSGSVRQGPELVADTFGGVYLAYSEDTSPTTTQLRTAHLDSGGTVTCNGSEPGGGGPLMAQDHPPLVVYDGGGGAYIVWEDDRVVGGSGSRNIFASRIDSVCVNSWGSPVNIANDTFTLNPLRLNAATPSPTGLYVSFTVEGPTDSVHVVNVNESDGSMAWPSGMDGEEVATGNTSNSFLVPTVGGDVMVVYDDTTGGDTETHVQRLSNADGSNQFPAAGNTLISGIDATLANTIRDGTNGAFFSLNSPQNNGDVYAGYVDATGSLVAGWNSTGNQVASLSLIVQSQELPRTVIDSNDNSFVVWWDRRNFPTSGVDLYAQKYDAAGVAQWSDPGVIVSDLPGNDLLYTDIFTDGTNLYVGWLNLTGGDNRVFVQKLGPDGSEQWASGGILLSNVGGVNLYIVTDDAGGLYATWAISPAVLVQHVAFNGVIAPGFPANGADVSAPGYGFAPSIIADGSGGVYVTWGVFQSGNTDIFLQHLNTSGVESLPSGGLAVTSNPSYQDIPIMVLDGYGGVIIAFQDSGSGDNDVYAQRVDADGNILWAPDGVPVVATAGWQNLITNFPYRIMIADGEGGAVISWFDQRSCADIYAQRIGDDGTPVWDLNGVRVTTTFCGTDGSRSVTDDGEGNMVIGWTENQDIFVTQLDRLTGAKQFGESLTATDDPAAQQNPSIARGPGPIGPSYTVVWDDRRNDPATNTLDVFGQHFLTAAQLTVIKTVVNDNSGMATPDSFGFRIDGGPTFASGVTQMTTAGSHTLSEDPVDGYTASVWGGDCVADGSITFAGAEEKTCTITNDDNVSGHSPVGGSVPGGGPVCGNAICEPGEDFNICPTDCATLGMGLIVPGKPVITRLSPTEVRITVATAGNSENTFYAIQDAVSGNYVQGNGELAPIRNFRTFAQWGRTNGAVIKLAPNTQYRFRVIAKVGL